MSIPHARKKTQAPFSPDRPTRTTASLVPHDAERPFLAPADGPAPGEDGPEALRRLDTDGPERCAACGRPYAPFSLRASGVLDMVLLAKDVLSDIQRCVEQEALP